MNSIRDEERRVRAALAAAREYATATGRPLGVASPQTGPVADVFMARHVRPGWHMEGVGTIGATCTHPSGQTTFSGPLGYRTFGLDTLVEATPARA